MHSERRINHDAVASKSRVWLGSLGGMSSKLESANADLLAVKRTACDLANKWHQWFNDHAYHESGPQLKWLVGCWLAMLDVKYAYPIHKIRKNLITWRRESVTLECAESLELTGNTTQIVVFCGEQLSLPCLTEKANRV